MPGSWVCQLIPQPDMATDMASVRPLRSASSDSRAVPAWDTRFFPSVVTLIDPVARGVFRGRGQHRIRGGTNSRGRSLVFELS